jgi:serpin B
MTATTTAVTADQAARDRATVAKGNNQFAVDLYARLGEQEGNLFFSPYSLSTALAMTYAGARGATAQEMARALHFTLESARLHAALAGLLRLTTCDRHGFELSTANALWPQKGLSLLPEFLATVRREYLAGLEELDFAGDTEGARQTINAWVENQTHDRIKELLVRGILTPDSVLVLTNAVYFKAPWEHPFQEAATRDEDFRLSSGRKVRVPFMHQTQDLRYLDGDTFQALELPYGGYLSLVVFLPRKVDGLVAFEKSLTAARVDTWLKSLKTYTVDVSLPRFKTTARFSLAETLSRMGMSSAFSAAADFSGIAGGRGLYISAVEHQACVDVDEEGTEAAAATAVVIRCCATIRLEPPERSVFKADHPFLYLIYDTATGSILFLGRFTNPRN